VLVTNQAVREDQDKKTQQSLNILTAWLFVFTVILAGIGGFTIWTSL